MEQLGSHECSAKGLGRTISQILAGELVCLSILSHADTQMLADWFSRDIELLRFSSVRSIYPHSSAADWERRSSSSDKYYFGIHVLADEQLIGNGNISSLNWQARSGEIGISIADKNFRSRGYGTNAVRLLLHFGFMELNLNRIELYTYDQNPRAIRAYQKAGFVIEGYIRHHIQRDRVYGNSVVMSVLRKQWVEQQNL
jgi:RimJ/RimL family protein N-acetyltransferase